MARYGRRDARGGRGGSRGRAGTRGSRSRGGRGSRDRYDDDYDERPMPARKSGMGTAEIALIAGGGVLLLVLIGYFLVGGMNPENLSPVDHESIRQEHRQDLGSVAAGELLEEAKSFENLEEFEYAEQIVMYQKVIRQFPGTPQAREAAACIERVRKKEAREW